MSYPYTRRRSPNSPRRPWYVATLPLFLVTALFAVSALGQRLAPSIPPQDAKALQSISRTLSLATDATSKGLFQATGYSPSSAPPGWASFPLVRKFETLYLAAEQHTPEQGGKLLALMAQSLAQQYDGVRYDPALKEYLSLQPPAQISFAIRIDSTVTLDPKIQRAILAISRYTERGHLGGAAGILQYYFNLPPETAYEILRTSPTNDVALARGLEHVPPEDRHRRLSRLVSSLDSTFRQTAILEHDLDPYRPSKNKNSAIDLVKIEHTSKPDDLDGSPNGPTGGGGGPSPSTPPPAERAEAPSSASRFSEAPQEVYKTRVHEWYGSGPVVFEEMVAVEGGFGGIVFGNSFKALSPKRLTNAEYLGLAPTEGQLIFHFADGSEATYGPVELGDVYAARTLVYGEGNNPSPLRNDQGVGLIGIEGRHSYYDVVDSEIAQIGIRFSVVVYPAISRVALGRSALMCDILPIGRVQLETLVRQFDKSKIEMLYQAIPADVGNWKITDAPVTISLAKDQIVVRNSKHPSSPNTFLSIREFRRGKRTYDPMLTPKFEAFAPVLTAASPDYQHLSQFVPVFDLFRWASSQGVEIGISPENGNPAKDQMVPDWVVVETNGYRFLFNGASVSPLQDLRAKVEHSLAEERSTAPAEWQTQLRAMESPWLKYAGTLEATEFEREQMRSDMVNFYQLSQRLHAAARASLVEEDYEDVQQSTGARLASYSYQNADPKQYEKPLEDLDKFEIGLLPSEEGRIRQKNLTWSKHRLRIADLERDANSQATSFPEDRAVLAQFSDLLTVDKRKPCEMLKGPSVLKLASDFQDSYSESFRKMRSEIDDYFSHAQPTVQRKFRSFDPEDWGTPEFREFLQEKAPSLYRTQEPVLLNLAEVQSKMEKAEHDEEQATDDCEELISTSFPKFKAWSNLLISYEAVQP